MITERQISERIDGLMGQFYINCIDIDVFERLDRLITDLKSIREDVANERKNIHPVTDRGTTKSTR
jgi:hypothetical protein